MNAPALLSWRRNKLVELNIFEHPGRPLTVVFEACAKPMQHIEKEKRVS